MMVNKHGLSGEWVWQLFPGAPIEHATIDLLVDAAPLLEEEGYLGIDALVTDTAHPIRFDRTCSGAGFSPDDCPVDAGAMLVREKRYYLYTGIAMVPFKVIARGGLPWHSSYLR